MNLTLSSHLWLASVYQIEQHGDNAITSDKDRLEWYFELICTLGLHKLFYHLDAFGYR